MRALQPGIWLLVWLYVYLVALLATWVIVVSLITGWRPTVVASASMSPAIRAGDVLLLQPADDDRLAQGTVITVESPAGSGELLTHRISAVEADGYVTKGDANASPDTTKVAFEDVRGAGRLVVPLIGLPALWLRSDPVVFGAWVAITVMALLVGLLGTRRLWAETSAAPRSPPGVAAKAMRRVRMLVGVLIVSQYVIDERRFELVAGRLSPVHVLALALGSLLVLNVASVAVARRDDLELTTRFSVAELILDTLLVLLITIPTGTGGIGWVLFSLPIVEAATRFRLTGALLHWMGLTAVALMARIWLVETAGAPGDVLVDLERMLDQLSVLLLVVVPGAYLAEQLVSDVLAHMRATTESSQRSHLLQRVVETGRRVNEFDTEVIETLATSALDLGFDGVDVWARLDGSTWQVLATAGPASDRLPVPHAAASGLDDEDLALPAVLVDHDYPDPDEVAGLQTAGLNGLVRLRLSTDRGSPVMLRAAVATHRPLTRLSIEALQLLVSQASVALRNDGLLTELKDAHEGLSRQAESDPLTGLANRPKFLAMLQAALADARRSGDLVAVLFLDLDGFKGVNDRLGHEVGDAVLEQVAGRLLRCVRDDDLVARFGGDEFTVLLPGIDRADSIDLVARRISQLVTEPFDLAHENVAVGVSIGIATSADQQETADTMLSKADLAMYHSKSRSDVSWAHFHPDMDVAPRRRAILAHDVRSALADDDLRIVYQPIVKAGQHRPVVGVEALLRWEHPELGPISPTEVIDLAEQVGITGELNEWVLTRACVDAAGWARRAAGPRLQITVNLSPAELESPRLLANVRSALDRSGLENGLLIIELSERILAPGHSAYDENLRELAELGIGIALDDFGAGRTSLSFLRSLPIDGIKLDRSFVVNLVESGADRLIVQSVVELAHELGLYVVAEGIETVAHLDEVEAIGCDFLQGYHLYMPTGAAEIMDLVNSRSSSKPSEAIGARSVPPAERVPTDDRAVGPA